jgi:hypothetical protein
MVSQYYRDNVNKANEWLHENAPDYVMKCLEEAFEIVMKQDENVFNTIKQINKFAESLDKVVAERNKASANTFGF